MIKIITKEQCSIEALVDIISLCAENRHLKNFTDVDYRNNPKSLLYKFVCTDTFSENNGAYLLLYENNELVHMSGVNKSEFSDKIYICGVRTLTKKSHQHQLLMSQYMLPAQEAIVKVLGGKMRIFCFEDGGSLYNIVKKGKFNLFLQNQAVKYNVYEGLTPYNIPVNINHTKHYILYKLLDKDFVFDWEKIHYDR